MPKGGEGVAAPETGGEELEGGGGAAEVGREAEAEGGDVAGGEEEGAV